MKYTAILLVILSLGLNIQASEKGLKGKAWDFAINTAYNAGNQLADLGANLDFAKQAVMRNADTAVNVISAFQYRNHAAKVSVVAGLALLQWALINKVKFNKAEAIYNILKAKNQIAKSQLVNADNSPKGVKYRIEGENLQNAQASALQVEKANNKKSLILALTGTALTAAGYLYHK